MVVLSLCTASTASCIAKSSILSHTMKRFNNIFPSKKRRQPLLPESDAVRSVDTPSTSNLDLAAQTASPPFGCEILFEGTTPIVAE
jgi:hypothetical protein